jgi:serine/threonine protein kinase
MFLATIIEFFFTMIKLETPKPNPFQCCFLLKPSPIWVVAFNTYFIVSSDSNNSPRIVANSWGKKHWPGTKDISVAIGCNDPTFVNFLEGCLRWDKNQRLSPDELMQHSWIVGVSIYITSRLQ